MQPKQCRMLSQDVKYNKTTFTGNTVVITLKTTTLNSSFELFQNIALTFLQSFFTNTSSKEQLIIVGKQDIKLLNRHKVLERKDLKKNSSLLNNLCMLWYVAKCKVTPTILHDISKIREHNQINQTASLRTRNLVWREEVRFHFF